MTQNEKWFYNQGKKDGLFGIHLVNLKEQSEENNYSYLMGYTEGSMERASKPFEENIKALAKNEYIRSIGMAVAMKNFPASDEHLTEEEKAIFKEGFETGLKNKTRK